MAEYGVSEEEAHMRKSEIASHRSERQHREKQFKLFRVFTKNLELILLTVLFIWGRVALYVFGEMDAVVSRIADDAAYFYQIARNLAQGNGLTFDGINATNGFQPLWLYVLLPLAWVLQNAPVELYLRAALIYQVVLLAIAGIVFFFAVSHLGGRGAALVATGIFYILAARLLANGMESGILAVCTNMLLYFSLKYRPFSKDCSHKHAIVFGLLLGLTILARLDMIFLFLIIYTVVIFTIITKTNHLERVTLVKQSTASIIACGALLLPYFIYNKLMFDSIMPISGELKNTFPHIFEGAIPFILLGYTTDRGLLVAMLIFAYTIMAFLLSTFLFLRSPLRTETSERYKLSVLIIGTLYVIAHYLHTTLFMSWGIGIWHFAVYIFHACALSAYIVDNLFRRLSTQALRLATSATTAAILAVLAANSYIVAKTQPKGWQLQSYRAAVWARTHLPQDARLALTDSGLFGMLSERSVVNLDGIVNNMEYQEALKRRQLNDYFRRKGVRYLVMHAYRPYPLKYTAPNYKEVLSANYSHVDIAFRSHLTDTLSDPIRVYREDEVYRSPAYYDGAFETVFIIWRLRW